MPNILFLSNNELFQTDLTEQITNSLSDSYKVYTQDNENTVWDIAILDEESFLADFREKHPKVPALILEPAENNFGSGNKLDILVFKPIVLSSLLTQIQSGINIFANSEEGYLCFGDYELHPADKELLNIKTKNTAKLTEREVNIIQYLYKLQGKPADKNELLQNVWEYSSDVTTHTIETHIYRLRKKVEISSKDKPIIEAENGGYKLIF